MISGDADEPLGWGRRVPLELRAPAGLPGVRPLESQWDLPLPQCQDVWDVERYVALVREVEEATLDVGGGGGGPRARQEDAAVSPLINLETQHDGRSARAWMKRV